MAKDKQVRCMCNSTYCGEICPHCGMPGATARFFFSDNGKTGVGFAVIFFACVGFVFGYYYLDVKAPFSSSPEIDNTDTEISAPRLLGTIPDWGSDNAPIATTQTDTEESPTNRTVEPPLAPTVKAVTPTEETVTPPPAPPEKHTAGDSAPGTDGEKTTQPQRQPQNGQQTRNTTRHGGKARPLNTRSRAVPIKPRNTPKNTTDAERKPADSSPRTESKLTKLSAADAEKLVEPLLRILVGTQDAGQLINTHFNEKVVETESSIQIDRDELKERLDEYNARYPVRAIKIVSVGVSGLRMELITARIFQNAEGDRVIKYGQTQVLIGQGGIIEGITDSIGDAKFPLSSDFAPINYKGKKIINNKTK